MFINSAYIKVEQEVKEATDERVAITYEVKFNQNDNVEEATKKVMELARNIIEGKESEAVVVPKSAPTPKVKTKNELLSDLFDTDEE